ncbi:MAG: hypothetical protein UR43_C0010G0030 [candidate division TM6 bacterium GW2011_GWF2_33_332]|nr:MAG: hypothetical protein UR43_C0010G0030 [candidate division TM6 bacterium GW2011_GWF2_33_332]
MHKFENRSIRQFIGLAFIIGGILYLIYSLYHYFNCPFYHKLPNIMWNLSHYPLAHFIPDWIYCFISMIIGFKILKSHNTPFHLANILFIVLISSNFLWLENTHYKIIETYRFAGNFFLITIGLFGLIYFEKVNRIWTKPIFYNVIRYILYFVIIIGIWMLSGLIYNWKN